MTSYKECNVSKFVKKGIFPFLWEKFIEKFIESSKKIIYNEHRLQIAS